MQPHWNDGDAIDGASSWHPKNIQHQYTNSGTSSTDTFLIHGSDPDLTSPRTYGSVKKMKHHHAQQQQGHYYIPAPPNSDGQLVKSRSEPNLEAPLSPDSTQYPSSHARPPSAGPWSSSRSEESLAIDDRPSATVVQLRAKYEKQKAAGLMNIPPISSGNNFNTLPRAQKPSTVGPPKPDRVERGRPQGKGKSNYPHNGLSVVRQPSPASYDSDPKRFIDNIETISTEWTHGSYRGKNKSLKRNNQDGLLVGMTGYKSPPRTTEPLHIDTQTSVDSDGHYSGSALERYDDIAVPKYRQNQAAPRSNEKYHTSQNDVRTGRSTG